MHGTWRSLARQAKATCTRAAQAIALMAAMWASPTLAADLDNSTELTGTILLAQQQNSYTFAVNAGDSVLARVGRTSGTLQPRVRIYAPNGSEVTSNINLCGNTVSGHNFRATQSGTYTLTLADCSTNLNNTGSYRLHFLRAPGGNEGGNTGTAGDTVAGDITIGDIDSHVVQASAGDSVLVRVGATSGTLKPRLRIYAPDGSEVTSSTNLCNVGVSGHAFQATQTGTYTAVTADCSTYLDGTGTYELHAVKAPGGQDGGTPVPDGRATAGSITLGDLDAHAINATAGEGILVRVGATSGTLKPRLRIYAPDGSEVTSNTNLCDASVSGHAFQATQTGTYTAVTADCSTYLNGTGDYNLHVVRAPGANEGGSLNDAAAHAAHIDVGDLDSFTLTANAGDAIRLSAVNQSTATQSLRLRVYGPTGAETTFNTNTCNNPASAYNFTASAAGTYTVVVADCTTYLNGTGDYTLMATGATGTPPSSGAGNDSGDVPLPAWALALLGGALMRSAWQRGQGQGAGVGGRWASSHPCSGSGRPKK